MYGYHMHILCSYDSTVILYYNTQVPVIIVVEQILEFALSTAEFRNGMTGGWRVIPFPISALCNSRSSHSITTIA